MAQWNFPWYIAGSLETLRGQLNAMAPRRSKVSDGGIGDAAHAGRTSDHNPNSYRNAAGARQVCARDFTHDPAGGLDCHWLATKLTTSGDTRIKYIIWNRAIWTPGVGWQKHTGDNPHTKHLHLSVKAGAIGDNTGPWSLGGATPSPGGGGSTPGRPADQEGMEIMDRVECKAIPSGGWAELEMPGGPRSAITIYPGKEPVWVGNIYFWGEGHVPGNNQTGGMGGNPSPGNDALKVTGIKTFVVPDALLAQVEFSSNSDFTIVAKG